MNKKHTITLAITIVVVGVLAGLAGYKYEHRVKGLSLQQVAAQRDTAQKDAAAEHAIAQNNAAALKSAQAQLADQTAQKAQACATLTKYKLVAPVCK